MLEAHIIYTMSYIGVYCSHFTSVPEVVDATAEAATVVDTPVTISLPVARPTAAKSFSDTQSNMLNNVLVSLSKSPKL